MKKTFYVLACAFLLSCAASKNTVPQNLSGNWQLTVFPSATNTFAEIFGDRKPELQFESGKFSGSTGCNKIFGDITVTGDQLIFPQNMGMTKMACPGYEESIFLNALGTVKKYRVQDNTLDLLNDSTIVMTFTRQQ